LFALYVAGYSLGRIGEELLRVDPAHHILGLRLNLYVGALLFVGGVIWFAGIQGGWRGARRWRKPTALLIAGAAVALSGCGGAGPAKAAANGSAQQVAAQTATSSDAGQARRSDPAAHPPALDSHVGQPADTRRTARFRFAAKALAAGQP
jgi:hypothetical protein